MTRYAVFDTAIGWASLAWNDNGLAAVRLPERDAEVVRKAILRRFPDAVEDQPSSAVAAVVADIRKLMTDGQADFANALLDDAATPEFDRKVYDVARTIPPGQTLTYGEVATRLGDKLLARDVGAALGRNPWPIVVPCHRVTAAGGKLGGFSAPGGQRTKLKLLAIEGAAAAAQGDLFG